MQTEIRFIYASYKTRERAEAALEDMFATGDVFQAERPRIERRNGWHHITLDAAKVLQRKKAGPHRSW